MDALLLVVDDDPAILETLRVALETALSAQVLAFSSPLEALAGMGARAPAVVISDLCMPGMSGLAFLEAVRERAPDTPASLITGHFAALRAERDGAAARVNAVLQKPFSMAELISTVQLLLSSSSPRPHSVAPA